LFVAQTKHGEGVQRMQTENVAQERFRVYVIEPEVLLGKALCSLFSEDREIEMVGDSRTFEVDALVQADPHLVLLDCDSLMGIRDTIAQCRAAVPKARICVLSAQLRPELMLRALWAGADGYVVKDITPDELVRSLKRILSDGFHADPRLTSVLLRNRFNRDVVELSARELDVARLIAQGLSNREIGEKLMLSDKTVKNHVSNIFSKLHMTARTQVAIYMLQNGLT
jgi:DNA-binding NarL/FixJ family response regulator